MEISILVNTNYVSSTGIVEDIAEFVNTPNRIFLEGEELLNENKIYKRSGNDFLAEDYDVGDEPIYLLNEILFKDNKLQFVSEVIGNDVILQPEEYLPPESLAYGTWNNRYAK